jgi:hypothetical protein
LCWKIWHAFKSVFDRDYSRTGGVFEESVPANIVFRISLREDHPLDDSLKILLDNELLYVHYEKLSAYTSFSASLTGEVWEVMLQATSCD